jgi:hypothetical protein
MRLGSEEASLTLGKAFEFDHSEELSISFGRVASRSLPTHLC